MIDAWLKMSSQDTHTTITKGLNWGPDHDSKMSTKTHTFKQTHHLSPKTRTHTHTNTHMPCSAPQSPAVEGVFYFERANSNCFYFGLWNCTVCSVSCLSHWLFWWITRAHRAGEETVGNWNAFWFILPVNWSGPVNHLPVHQLPVNQWPGYWLTSNWPTGTGPSHVW